jgi:hypothetical protein
VLRRYGATGFANAQDDERRIAMLGFKVQGRAVKFILPMPDPKDKRYALDGRGAFRSAGSQQRVFEQDLRQRWRALALCIKVKLEAVEAEIVTFEEEFLAHLVMPNGKTIGENVIPQYEKAIESGAKTPLMLGM